jgi:hypothetical protein
MAAGCLRNARAFAGDGVAPERSGTPLPRHAGEAG